MPLPSECSYDTESGTCPDGEVRNILIQFCSTSASSPEDSVLLEGEDCYMQFLSIWEETLWDVKLYFYNAKWEGKPFINALIRAGYTWKDSRKLGPSQWSCIEDPMKIYKITVTNSHGFRLVICDDLLQTACSMEKAADLVRNERPEWFSKVGEHTKKHIDKSLYNTWYGLPGTDPRRKEFIEYSKLDAFSQAMICRWLSERGMHECLTSASNGLAMALHIRYGRDEKWQDRRTFTERYPPLPREMQDMVEESLQGGYVWGLVGDHRGVFCHADYSSSYPYEYAFGKLFAGEVKRIVKGDALFGEACGLSDDEWMIWKVVSFRFEFIEGMMPCLSGVMCRNSYEPLKGVGNKKMRSGTVEHKLFTSSYLRELGRHYHLTDLEVEEVWIATPRRGDFKAFIRKCYTEKSRPELKGTMERDIWKRAMNAGVHGKTITKTHRKKCIYASGERETVDELNEPALCSLIGFTGMMNARERLLRHGRMVIEKGYRIFMCDTDSMVCGCTEAQFREAIGDWFEKDGAGFDNLGRFDMEKDSEGNTEFDRFKCWGLKRYCELNHGKFRKAAFAGMHEEIQTGVDEDGNPTHIFANGRICCGLAQVPVNSVNDKRFFAWKQTTRKWGGECYLLLDQLKKCKAENVWYEKFDYEDYMKKLGDMENGF